MAGGLQKKKRDGTEVGTKGIPSKGSATPTPKLGKKKKKLPGVPSKSKGKL